MASQISEAPRRSGSSASSPNASSKRSVLQRAPHDVRTPAAANTEMNRSFLLRDERIEIPRGFVSARDLAPRASSYLVSEPSVRSDPPSRFQQPEPRFRAVPDTNE